MTGSRLHTEGSQNGVPRPLRFITNEGAPPPKRRRVLKACQTCRNRKVACDGRRPHCGTCAHSQLACGGFATARTTTKVSSNSDTKDAERRRSTSPPIVKSSQGSDLPETLVGSILSSDSPSGLKTQDESRDHVKDRNTQRTQNRMPYFRWLGPTAIMPGFKQMVVRVREHDSKPNHNPATANIRRAQAPPTTLAHFHTYPGRHAVHESDANNNTSFPFYDTFGDSPSELVLELVETFFVRVGCNFPFLRKTHFVDDLRAKRVDPILVNAICAISARFSTHPLLVSQRDGADKVLPSDYGQAFAHRARMALVHTYAVPTIAATQAALLLAYNEFGENRDSGLWMYLGIAIRMAQDLGLQKLEGLNFEGREGPTPKMLKAERSGSIKSPASQMSFTGSRRESDEAELRAYERERVDTFWAVFFLDRAVSSGVGRLSALRDKDIELAFPPLLPSEGGDDLWPSPFPALLRIVHLYGCVADVINAIEGPSDISEGTSTRLADIEAQVTDFYQALPPRLRFETMNFHHYTSTAGEGTNFVLLHFWFHSAIILLHQPTLLKTFVGKKLRLFANSQQLSMSSAKTIADILSYSQLIDVKAFLGNPFTTQPIYVAACAFLNETLERTVQSTTTSPLTSEHVSNAATPSNQDDQNRSSPSVTLPADTIESPKGSESVVPILAARNGPTEEQRSAKKHTLIMKQASQDYQRCYQALQSLETYWAGTKYILTVLDQKSSGVLDPLLYTVEESESSLEQPAAEPSYSSPGWRGKLMSKMSERADVAVPVDAAQGLGGPTTFDADPTQAFGWTMTGDLNSTNTNLGWHYSSNPAPSAVPAPAFNTGAGFHIPRPISNATVANGVESSTLAPNIGHSTQGDHTTDVPLAHLPSTLAVLTASSNHNNNHPSHRDSFGTWAPTHERQPQHQSQQHPTMFPPGLHYNAAAHLRNPQSSAVAQMGDITIANQNVDLSMLDMDFLSWLDPQQSGLMRHNFHDGQDGP